LTVIVCGLKSGAFFSTYLMVCGVLFARLRRLLRQIRQRDRPVFGNRHGGVRPGPGPTPDAGLLLLLQDHVVAENPGKPEFGFLLLRGTGRTGQDTNNDHQSKPAPFHQ